MAENLGVFKLAFWKSHQSCSCPFWWEYWVRQVAPKILACPSVYSIWWNNLAGRQLFKASNEARKFFRKIFDLQICSIWYSLLSNLLVASSLNKGTSDQIENICALLSRIMNCIKWDRLLPYQNACKTAKTRQRHSSVLSLGKLKFFAVTIKAIRSAGLSTKTE